IDHHRDDADRPRGAMRAATLQGLLIRSTRCAGHERPQWVMSSWARSPGRMVGGVVKVCAGAGEGIVHSRPRAPSQQRSAAFAPCSSQCYRIAAIMKGVMNRPNAPIELIRFQSAKATL